MIAAPRFWRTHGWQSRLLSPVAMIYGAFAGHRLMSPARHSVDVPVVAVGNFVAGGAGKTPTAIALTRIAIETGFSPIVLMRGYGGALARQCPVLVNPAEHTARDVGDEALMIAEAGVAVIAARDRAAGADLAVRCGCDLIILDDGFQSPNLAKDLSLVVVDDVYGVGNGSVIPAGPLRAPLHQQIAALDALIVISNGDPGLAATTIRDEVARNGKPVFAARIEPDLQTQDFRGRRVLAFAGIGRPEKLAEGLSAGGAIVEALIAFPDHHQFTAREAKALLTQATDRDLSLVTTAKDMARLKHHPDPNIRQLAERSQVAGIRLIFEDEPDFAAFLGRKLSRSSVRVQS